MRRFCLSLFATVVALAVEVSAEEAPTLKVMSYNLRYAAPLGENSWPVRRPILKQCIEKNDPDLIGTQEGLYHQLRNVADDLPAYAWIGLGREGGSRGEFMAIYYKKDRFEPLEYDHYWLSDTPNVISSTSWGNSVRRMVTWIKFHDRAAKRDFIHINTHFDHQVEKARQKSAELVAERTKKLSDRLPIILTGDFNSPAGEGSVAYKTLTAPGLFIDSWEEAEKGSPRTLSFNGFQFPAPLEGGRIDWILLKGPIRAKKILIDDFAADKQYPSDHFPVIATLEYAP